MAFAALMGRGRLARLRPRLTLTPRRVNLLIVLALAGLQLGVSLSAPLWARFLGSPVPASVEEGTDDDGTATPTPTPRSAAEAERKINVKLLFAAADRIGLVTEERAVAYHADLSRQLKAVLAELLRGSDAGLVAPFDSGTRVLEVFVSSQGCAYVDLSREALGQRGIGSQAELMSVYAVVNTLAINFPAVKRVQVLVEDRPVDCLAGHADVSRPLLPDMTLLAPAMVTSSATLALQGPAPAAPARTP